MLKLNTCGSSQAFAWATHQGGAIFSSLVEVDKAATLGRPTAKTTEEEVFEVQEKKQLKTLTQKVGRNTWHWRLLGVWFNLPRRNEKVPPSTPQPAFADTPIAMPKPGSQPKQQTRIRHWKWRMVFFKKATNIIRPTSLAAAIRGPPVWSQLAGRLFLLLSFRLLFRTSGDDESGAYKMLTSMKPLEESPKKG